MVIRVESFTINIIISETLIHHLHCMPSISSCINIIKQVTHLQGLWMNSSKLDSPWLLGTCRDSSWRWLPHGKSVNGTFIHWQFSARNIITAIFNTTNIIIVISCLIIKSIDHTITFMVSSHIHRTEICQHFTNYRREFNTYIVIREVGGISKKPAMPVTC